MQQGSLKRTTHHFQRSECLLCFEGQPNPLSNKVASAHSWANGWVTSYGGAGFLLCRCCPQTRRHNRNPRTGAGSSPRPGEEGGGWLRLPRGNVRKENARWVETSPGGSPFGQIGRRGADSLVKKPGGERQVLAHVGSLAQVDELHFLSRWEGMRFRSDKARGGGCKTWNSFTRGSAEITGLC